MDIRESIKSRINFIRKFLYRFKSKGNTHKNIEMWENSLADPTEYYIDLYRFFNHSLPISITQHKYYFKQNKRGFGEDAFHAMWFLLYERYGFANFLEIGVYRGQVMSLVALLAKLKHKEVEITGISPFNKSGDSVSKYVDIDYIDDINQNFDFFHLTKPKLVSAYSTDSEAVSIISSSVWDCIYIDGSHDYEIVKQDWNNCSSNVKIGGIIVIDDSSLFTSYKNPFFAFKGHPGPSKVADEVDLEKFQEILRVGHNRVFKRLK